MPDSPYILDLYSTSRVFVSWLVGEAIDPDGAYEVGLINGAWQDLTVDGQSVKLLVAGPNLDPADQRDGDLIITDTVRDLRIRLKDNPEIVIGDAGIIRLIN